MPNTKSAERRVRNSARRSATNRRVKSRLKTLERRYSDSLKAGKKEDALTAFRNVTSAFDKAAKTGVVHWRKANRKKSRLSVGITQLK